MAPVYNFDPSTVVASFEVLPKGEYEFEIGTPKPFLRQNRKNEDSFGIRYPLKVVAPEQFVKARVQPYSIYLQSEGGQSFAKQFLMAVLGYKKGREGEQQFDKDMAGKDWSFNPESGEVGDAYAQVAGSRVIGSVDVSKAEDGSDQQQFKSWRSITTGPVAQ